MNKTICSLMMGVVLCVIAPTSMADYCDDQGFGPSSDTHAACEVGVTFAQELGLPEENTGNICPGICGAIGGNGYSGDPYNYCVSACTSAAAGITPSCLGYFGKGSTSDNACNYGNNFWSASKYFQCAKLCPTNNDKVVSQGMTCTCIQACAYPTVVTCKNTHSN